MIPTSANQKQRERRAQRLILKQDDPTHTPFLTSQMH
jgi:hypothetical protein